MMRYWTNLRLGTKINSIVVLALLLFSIIITVAVNLIITDGIKQFASEKANSDLRTTYAWIDEKFPGDWHIKEGELFKGETRINENFELVDEVAQMIDGTVTIFQGDTRVATTVTIDNERAVGTKASEEVLNKVLQNGEVFYGEANVAGEMLQTAYMPIKDQNGEIIGMWYVGVSQELIDSTVSATMFTINIVNVIIVIATVIAMLVFTKYQIANRLKRVASALEKAGNGDFTNELEDKSNDEIGILVKSYMKMKQNLSNLIHTVAETSHQVSSSAEELSASAEETSKATENITMAIQEVAESADRDTEMTENAMNAANDISTGMDQIENNMTKVKEAALLSGEKSNAGIDVLRKVINQMNIINENTNSISSNINELGNKSGEIEEIIKLITDVAEQTNLLALNAAIEAARAGEHGRGFAVVADEVRKLAEQASESSGQISQLVKEIQTGIEQSVSSMAEGRESVREGIKLADKAGESFSEISEAIDVVISQVQEVSAAITQIASRLDNLVAAINERVEIAKNTAMNNQNIAAAAEEQNASMEEIASLSDMLLKMADELETIVKEFRL